MTPVLFKKEIYMITLHINNQTLQIVFWNKTHRDIYLSNVVKPITGEGSFANHNKCRIDGNPANHLTITAIPFYSRCDYDLNAPPSIARIATGKSVNINIASDDKDLLDVVNDYFYHVELEHSYTLHFADNETIVVNNG